MIITKVPNGLVVVFHYVSKAEQAQEISKRGVIVPSDDYLHLLNGHEIPDKTYVALTDVMPEEGKDIAAIAMGVSEKFVNFGLEILIDPKRLSEPQHMLRAYRVYSDKDMPVKVLRIWNMERVTQKISSGHRIHRFIGHNGFPYAFYERKE